MHDKTEAHLEVSIVRPQRVEVASDDAQRANDGHTQQRLAHEGPCSVPCQPGYVLHDVSCEKSERQRYRFRVREYSMWSWVMREVKEVQVRQAIEKMI